MGSRDGSDLASVRLKEPRDPVGVPARKIREDRDPKPAGKRGAPLPCPPIWDLYVEKLSNLRLFK